MGPDRFLWPATSACMAVLAVVVISGSADAGAGRLLQDTGRWAIVSGSAERPSRTDLRWRARIDGDLCTDQGFVGSGSAIDGVLVATRSRGFGLDLRSAADVTHDVVTGGAGVRALPRSARLPGLAILGVPPGRRVDRGDGLGVYDTTGGDARVGECARARHALAAASDHVEALESDLETSGVDLRAGRNATLAATQPGQRNVIDMPTLRVGTKATLRLDGGGHPDTVLVLRVRGRVRTRLGATIVLVGGLRPSNVLIYAARGSCNLGDRTSGAGSLLCRDGNVSLGARSTWTGALLGGGTRVQLGAATRLQADPFTGW